MEVPYQLEKNTIYLVGAGCVNLITAYYLKRAGYDLTILDATPSPFNCTWDRLGCTWGGEDARMFTLTEADNYNQTSFPIGDESNRYFTRSIRDYGWDIRKIQQTELEKEWVNHHQEILPHQARLHEGSILSFNAESKGLWEIMQAEDSELFKDVEYHEGIIRLYSDTNHYQAQLARHTHRGSLIHNYPTPEELAIAHPSLSNAIASNNIAGGFKTIGFTVNAHKFLAKVIHWLELRDVSFHWNEKVERLHYNKSGKIVSLGTTERSLEGDNFILSLGAYGAELLQQTPASGIICGVLGAWLTIPHLSPKLEYSLKLVRKGHVTEDANITIATDKVGSPILIIGSGYGFTGTSPHNIQLQMLELIYEGLRDTARIYFPEAYKQAVAMSALECTQKYCIRPWTPSSLGIFETIPTSNGGKCIITGGHNTGGFAQAPAVAKAVLASLIGTLHPMHTLYQDTGWKNAHREKLRPNNATR